VNVSRLDDVLQASPDHFQSCRRPPRTRRSRQREGGV
jgi:hypothetical protein